MENNSKIAGKIKGQITHFAHEISRGFKKPLRKFVVQMLYGIQASKDVKLSNIARSLNEQIPLIKTEGRLSRNIGKDDLTLVMNKSLIADGAKRIKEDTVIAIDISDIDKPYAKKMEHLALVRDGSTGERRSNGYWLLSILGAHVDGEELIPLYGELYSQEADTFESENRQILRAVDLVREKTGAKGIWAIDRGGDRAIRISHEEDTIRGADEGGSDRNSRWRGEECFAGSVQLSLSPSTAGSYSERRRDKEEDNMGWPHRGEIAVS